MRKTCFELFSNRLFLFDLVGGADSNVGIRRDNIMRLPHPRCDEDRFVPESSSVSSGADVKRDPNVWNIWPLIPVCIDG
jgi:hypothetical protein